MTSNAPTVSRVSNAGMDTEWAAAIHAVTGGTSRPPSEFRTGMVKGTSLIKYGRQGAPHQTTLALIQDLQYLQYISKSGRPTKIPVKHMFNVLKGQSTEVFRRNKRNVAAAHERFCFSILYREMSPKGAVKERTLDLSAQGEIDFENWYYGLLAVKRLIPAETPRVASSALIDRGLTSVASLDTSASVTEARSSAMDDLSRVDEMELGHERPEDKRVYAPGPVGHNPGDVFIFGMSGTLVEKVRRVGGPRSRHWQEGSVPEVVRGSNNLDVYRVACSTRHAMLITRDGDIYTWGCGVGGVLGHGGDMDVDGPKHVAGLALERVRQVACSTWYSAAVTRSGRLYTWGSPSSLCLGTDAGHLRWVPQPVRGPFQRQRVRKVSCGPFHCAAVTRSGALYTWGDGYSGRLGHGNQETCLTPRLVDYLAACTVMDVSCGHFHTAAILLHTPAVDRLDSALGPAVGRSGATPDHRGGDLAEEEEERLGDSDLEDERDEAVQEDDAMHATVSQSGGVLVCWGQNDKGALGNGTRDSSFLPQRVEGELRLQHVRQVACGHHLTVALSSDGYVYQWGSVGGKNSFAMPVKVSRGALRTGTKCFQIACGDSHVIAALRSAGIVAWGRGAEGQLGLSPTPLQADDPDGVPTFLSSHVLHLACGGNHTMVVIEHSKQGTPALPLSPPMEVSGRDIAFKRNKTLAVKREGSRMSSSSDAASRMVAGKPARLNVANAVRAMRLAGGDQPTHNSPRESSTTGRTKWFTGGWFGKKPTGAHSVGSSEATTQAKGVASGTGLVLPSFPGADLPYQLGRQRTGSKAHFMIAQLDVADITGAPVSMGTPRKTDSRTRLSGDGGPGSTAASASDGAGSIGDVGDDVFDEEPGISEAGVEGLGATGGRRPVKADSSLSPSVLRAMASMASKPPRPTGARTGAHATDGAAGAGPGPGSKGLLRAHTSGIGADGTVLPEGAEEREGAQAASPLRAQTEALREARIRQLRDELQYLQRSGGEAVASPDKGPLSPTAAALRSGSPGHKRARSVATLRLSTGSLGLFPSHNDMDAKLESNRRLGYLLDKALLALHESDPHMASTLRSEVMMTGTALPFAPLPALQEVAETPMLHPPSLRFPPNGRRAASEVDSALAHAMQGPGAAGSLGHAGPVQDGHGEAGHPPVARLRLPLRQPGSQGGTAPVSARSGVSSATPTDSSHASPRVGRTEGSGAEGPRPGDSSDATEEIEVEPEIFFRVRVTPAGKVLERVRFGKKRFDPQTAAKYFAANRERLCREHDIKLPPKKPAAQAGPRPPRADEGASAVAKGPPLGPLAAGRETGAEHDRAAPAPASTLASSRAASMISMRSAGEDRGPATARTSLDSVGGVGMGTPPRGPQLVWRGDGVGVTGSAGGAAEGRMGRGGLGGAAVGVAGSLDAGRGGEGGLGAHAGASLPSQPMGELRGQGQAERGQGAGGGEGREGTPDSERVPRDLQGGGGAEGLAVHPTRMDSGLSIASSDSAADGGARTRASSFLSSELMGELQSTVGAALGRGPSSRFAAPSGALRSVPASGTILRQASLDPAPLGRGEAGAELWAGSATEGHKRGVSLVLHSADGIAIDGTRQSWHAGKGSVSARAPRVWRDSTGATEPGALLSASALEAARSGGRGGLAATRQAAAAGGAGDDGEGEDPFA